MNKKDTNILGRSFKNGFTLMEVLAVVLIIGILSAVALPQYRKVVEKGKFTKAQVMAKAMYDSCERLVAEWGVDDYDSLPSEVRNQGVTRLDIGGADLLPPGFTLSGRTISGAGFTYTLNGNGCVLSILRQADSNYGTVSLSFDGTGFTCAASSDAQLCAIYGLD